MSTCSLYSIIDLYFLYMYVWVKYFIKTKKGAIKMSATVNVQQKIDRKIYIEFRSILMKAGISINDGLEAAILLYVEKKEEEKTADN